MVARPLFHFPSITREEEILQGTLWLLALDVLDLLLDSLIVGHGLNVADHSESDWKLVGSTSIAVWRVAHHSELEVEGRIGLLGVMNEEILLCDAVLADGHWLDVPAIEDETLIAVLTIDHWLAMLEKDGLVGTDSRIGDELVDAIGKDDTVTELLDDSCTLVLGSSYHAGNRTLDIAIDGTSEEVATSTEAKLCRTEWILYSTPR